MAASLFAENSSVSTDFVNNKTFVTVSDTNAESFEGTVSMFIISVEAIDSSAIFNVGIEVSKSDNIKLDCSTDASTSISDN
jgi:hypothetical protein